MFSSPADSLMTGISNKWNTTEVKQKSNTDEQELLCNDNHQVSLDNLEFICKLTKI
jgi:hypothetical protein